eukprot:7765464-Pyramimonas_sp.AAC.1
MDHNHRPRGRSSPHASVAETVTAPLQHQSLPIRRGEQLGPLRIGKDEPRRAPLRNRHHGRPGHTGKTKVPDMTPPSAP